MTTVISGHSDDTIVLDGVQDRPRTEVMTSCSA